MFRPRYAAPLKAALTHPICDSRGWSSWHMYFSAAPPFRKLLHLAADLQRLSNFPVELSAEPQAVAPHLKSIHSTSQVALHLTMHIMLHADTLHLGFSELC